MSFQTNGLDNSGNILKIGQYATSILLGNNSLQTITNYASETFIVSPIVPTPPSTSNTTVAASTAYVTTALSNFLTVAHTWTTSTQTFNAGPIVQTQAAASNTTIAASTQYVTTALSNFLTVAHTWAGQQIFSTTNKPQIGANTIIASTPRSATVLYYCGNATSVGGTVTINLTGFTSLLGVVVTPQVANGTGTSTVSAISSTGGGQFTITTSGPNTPTCYMAFGT